MDGSYVVCNGEIYGYEKIKEELAKKYTFKSGSDCEILLPLYREYGVDMFKMLGRTAGHLQNVVGVSSKVIAGNDVRMLSYILHKGVIVAGVLQSHFDQSSDGIANPGIIGYDGVRFNDAQSLHFPNSLNDGGNRQIGQPC